MPKVSIIVPVFNSKKYLAKCLDSLVGQTLKDLEIICVNDASTDGSLDILKFYAQNDNRIKIIDLMKNRGAGAARNMGIKVAEGEYIGFVDSDDYVDLDFYEKLYEKAIKCDADAAKGKLWLYDLEKQKKYLEDWIDINEKVKRNKAYFYFTFVSAIYKRSFVNSHKIRFLEGLVHFEDPFFTIKGSLLYKSFCLDDTACYYYTNNSKSSSRNITQQHIKDLQSGAKEVLTLINNADIDEEHYKIVFNFVMNQILCWCNSPKKEIMTLASFALEEIIKQCKYLQKCLEFHFWEKQQDQRRLIFSELRRKIQ